MFTEKDLFVIKIFFELQLSYQRRSIVFAFEPFAGRRVEFDELRLADAHLSVNLWKAAIIFISSDKIHFQNGLDFFGAVREQIKEKLNKGVPVVIAKRRLQMFRRDKVKRFRLVRQTLRFDLLAFSGACLYEV